MFQNLIISNQLSINNFFKKLNFDLYLTKPQLRHLESIMNAMISKGYNGKISDVAELASQRHRTSTTRFLSNSNWDETLLSNSLKLQVLALIWSKSKETNKPIYFIIDDTISEKTNRVIYPEGYKRLGIKLHKFATTLKIEDFDLVTVKDQEYYIYNYVGDLKDRKNVSIILSYSKGSFQKEGALKTFISLDTLINPLKILTQYTDRWAIEPFFRDCKSYLGLNGYQVRSERSIKRYLAIMIINYTYCKLYSNESHHFNTGFKLAQSDFQKARVIWIYNAAASGEPVEKIFEYLKIA